MTRTQYLREQTITSKNKVARVSMPSDWTTATENASLCERKAMGAKMIFENMPLYIGEQELIVGTRTMLCANKGNEDNHDISDYCLQAYPSYVNQTDIDYFGFNEQFYNKTHYTPDYSIILEQGIDGIIANCKTKLNENNLSQDNIDFLNSVIIAYNGLSCLINRYSEYAFKLSQQERNNKRKLELLEISRVCKCISHKPASNFYEAIQLMWFAHLATLIESFEFINYGRLDVIFNKYLANTKYEDAQQLIECLLLKMYDQVDLNQSYLNKYAAQLNITIGGILENGDNAVNAVSFMILNGVEKTALPEPEISIRINSKNPPEFLKKATQLSVRGLNFISYYNDDLFIESMIKAGVEVKYARDYSFDLCQDITIAGKGDFYCSGQISLVNTLMDFLSTAKDNLTFDEFITQFKEKLGNVIKVKIEHFNRTHKAFLEYKNGNKQYYFNELKNNKISSNLEWRSLMCPLPILSPLFHGSIDSATDMTLESYPVKHKGVFIGCPTEGINSLAAIKKYVYDLKKYKLSEVYNACENNFEGLDGEIMRNELWNAPKWGNDDDYIDLIAKDILEYCCKEISQYKTVSGGVHLAGIHQPHPVITGQALMATPEGRKQGTPVAVTLTPESGTMKNGPTATLKSAAKIDYQCIQWNYCVMISYFASTFKGNNGSEILENLIKSYFSIGGLQHQPNVMDLDDLKNAQLNPEKYKDLIVRLWGVSAHFVDLPKELQDEMIARLD
ncbi:pyruvate formate lyase family protein [Paludicola sp. MB14-C6]|uniref:pyruvate formate lyase family protein n=1 Tax=Paludihabitans sp. MB14-C6 TaxID=3070656 RepID=UPI0027DB59EA|nr:pyruvate formate lyase family protein [Paludicola sp. MB14-C6]WMJ22330.1 pyruvate formate lyase family protein [Paludicola sp. MB14-C6]